MSSFMVSENHINALVNFAANNKMIFNFGSKMLNATNPKDAQALVTILEKANLDSVNFLYQENNTELTYQFKYSHSVHSPMRIIVACDCLDYRSCEVNNWNTTQNFACRIIDWIKNQAIRTLPGYESVDWEIR